MHCRTSIKYISSICVPEQFINLDLHLSLISASFPCLYGSRDTPSDLQLYGRDLAYWDRSLVWHSRTA